MIPKIALPLALALIAAPVAAQSPPATAPAPSAPVALAAPGLGVPEALRGAWFIGGSCTRPEAMLFLTARAATILPAEGTPTLQRFAAISLVPGGWTLGVAAGPQAPRLALRSPGPDRLETVEPAAKTRDDRLPGEGAATRQWQRCPQVPAPTGALHAEGLAALAALEHMEAACGAGMTIRDCLAGILAQTDVSGDGAVSVAELARMGRGAAWLLALRSGAPLDAAQATAAAVSAMAAARRLVESLDYDGDGKLSAAELAQDRASFGSATGTAQGRPLPGLPLMPGLEGLHALLPGTAPAR